MTVATTARRRLDELWHHQAGAVDAAPWAAGAPELALVDGEAGVGPLGSVAHTPGLVGAVAFGAAGAALYNWWVAVALDHRLMPGPDQLFSDLEAQGLPHSTLFQHLDLVAGALLLGALLLRGPVADGGRRAEWPWLAAFAVAASLGGHFAYACPEGRSAVCRAAEWHLELPLHHYLHVASGVAEFATATVAAALAARRTAGTGTAAALWIHRIGRVLLVGYPVLAASYLADRDGAFVEPVFFLAFTAMVAVELLEPVGGRRRRTPEALEGAPGVRPPSAPDRSPS